MHLESISNTIYQTRHLLRIHTGTALLLALTVGLIGTIRNGFAAATDHWTIHTPNPTTLSVASGAFGNGKYVFIAGGQYGGQIITTPDLNSWNVDFRGQQLSWNSWRSVVHGGGQFVVAGESGTILTSTDAAEWTARSSGTSKIFLAITHGNGRYVAVGEDGVTSTSTDGVTWSASDIGDDNWYWSVGFGNNVFVAVSGSNTIATSVDGTNWTVQTLPPGTPNGWLNDVKWQGNQFVAVGGRNSGGGAVLTSPNGVDWTSVADTDLDFDGWLNGIAFDGTKHVAVGTVDNQAGAVLTSTDGVEWTFAQTTVCPNFWGVLHEGGQVIAVGAYGVIATSADFTTWTRRGDQVLRPFTANDIAFANGEFRLGGDGMIWKSTDAVSWTLMSSPLFLNIQSIAHGNGKWVAANVSNGINVMVHESAGNWVAGTVPASVQGARGVAFGADRFVALATTGTDPFISSTDGIDWSVVNTPGLDLYDYIVFDGGVFFAWRNPSPVLNTTETVKIATSTDGINWEETDTGMVGSIATGAAHANGRWVLVGRNVNAGTSGDWRVMVSADLTTWSEERLSFGLITSKRGVLQDVHYANGQWVIVGDRHLLWTAADEPTLVWEQTFNTGLGRNSNEKFLKVISDGDSFIVLGESRFWNSFGSDEATLGEVYQSGSFTEGVAPRLGIVDGPGENQVQLQIQGTVGVAYDILFHQALPVGTWQVLETVTPTSTSFPYDYTIPGGQDSGVFMLREAP